MVWRMLLADAGTEFTHFDTERAKANGKGRGPSHPLRRKEADVRAIAAKPDATHHQVLCLFVFRHVHADHVVTTGIADTRAIQTSLYAIKSMLIY